MASSRLARFITEVAPPQFVTVMRRRTAKVLDTIKEEEREVGTADSIFSSKIISSPFASPPYPSSVSSASSSSSSSSGLKTLPVTENRSSFPVFKN
ncbi:hypothetical protein CARUB_v10010742mg [Capsella rubella]|uniref:Uncharacterized protein n=1 Tax=Capsella rubella TaxID=81985 RepID=R0I4M0_9BRAS|nr:uncharacterized protein LOC17900249 [Capsella rubella]EOA37229.1 hypothetical protein CARUB_v10010742mg [Capsella rubella]